MLLRKLCRWKRVSIEKAVLVVITVYCRRTTKKRIRGRENRAFKTATVSKKICPVSYVTLVLIKNNENSILVLMKHSKIQRLVCSWQLKRISRNRSNVRMFSLLMSSQVSSTPKHHFSASRCDEMKLAMKVLFYAFPFMNIKDLV